MLLTQSPFELVAVDDQDPLPEIPQGLPAKKKKKLKKTNTNLLYSYSICPSIKANHLPLSNRSSSCLLLFLELTMMAMAPDSSSAENQCRFGPLPRPRALEGEVSRTITIVAMLY